jgi:uncharacterized membrane protein HdeD (DUF308 family)
MASVPDDGRGRKIPAPVTLVACLYLAVGVGGLFVHFSERGQPDWIWVELTEALAVVCSVFLLLAQNWARWLAVAWMAFHVAISIGEPPKLAMHGLFLVAIVWGLFRGDAGRYFQKR